MEVCLSFCLVGHEMLNKDPAALRNAIWTCGGKEIEIWGTSEGWDQISTSQDDLFFKGPP